MPLYIADETVYKMIVTYFKNFDLTRLKNVGNMSLHFINVKNEDVFANFWLSNEWFKTQKTHTED